MSDDTLKLPSRFQLGDEVAYAGTRAEVRGVSFVLMHIGAWGAGGKITYDLLTKHGLIKGVLSNDVSPLPQIVRSPA